MSERRNQEPEEFEELLRHWMQDGAPASAPEQILDNLRRSAMKTAQQSRRPGWIPVLGVAAAALAVVLLVVYVQETREVGQQEPSHTPSPTAGPSASVAAETGSARPSPSGSALPSVEWSRADVELPAANSSRMLAVDGGVGGYVAVGGGGSVEGFGGALAWHSTDGRSWALTLDAHAERDNSQMRDVIATDDGYVAVGHNVPGVAVWLSADGLSWREADGPSVPAGSSHSLVALASGNAGLNAIGFTSESDAQIATVWSSADFETWIRLDVSAAYASSWPVDIAIADDGTAVIVGMTQPGQGDPIAWVVRGGIIGEPIALPSEDPEASVTSVVSAGAGFTAVGSGWDPAESAYRLLAWRSIDGRSWEAVEADGMGLPLGAAQIDGRGVVAVGATMGLAESEVRAWQLSVEGLQVFAVEASNGAGHAALEGPDGRLLVVGASDPDGQAVVWIEP